MAKDYCDTIVFRSYQSDDFQVVSWAYLTNQNTLSKRLSKNEVYLLHIGPCGLRR